MLIWFIVVFLMGMSGGALLYCSRRALLPFTFGWIPFASIMVLTAVIVTPLTIHIGTNAARTHASTYKEFWGGWELQAVKTSQGCSRDGSCQDTHNCDPYEVSEVVLDYDSKGNISGSHTETHTEYHHCPVATQENDYVIKTTLGDFPLSYTFDHPAIPYRSSYGLDNTYQGDPPQWLAAKARIDANDPGPVTVVKNYQNYVLASTHTILKQKSGSIATYLAKQQLPPPEKNYTNPVHSLYYVDKMQFVGVDVETSQWEFALGQFNAAIGTTKQGDVHVVAIAANLIGDPDDYSQALAAYWQDPRLGKRALSKNGIGLVLGVSAGHVSWARAFTGMPAGNELFTHTVADALKGVPFTPAAIFGHPQGTLNATQTKVTVSDGTGALAKVVWGTTGYKRVCMTCKTPGDSGVGYSYLKAEIQPPTHAKVLMTFIALFISLFLLAIACGISFFTTGSDFSPDHPYLSRRRYS